MNKKTIWRIALTLFFVGISIIVFAAFYFFHGNDLGLTGFDLTIGGYHNMDSLRTATQAAADAFLAEHRAELGDISDQLVVDYSKSSTIRSLGYRSEFYYFHWIIYLPYSLHTQSGKTAIVVIRLSDATPEYKHDPKRFRVIDAVLLDRQGRETKRVNGG
jgi:hypothetical protein